MAYENETSVTLKRDFLLKMIHSLAKSYTFSRKAYGYFNLESLQRRFKELASMPTDIKVSFESVRLILKGVDWLSVDEIGVELDHERKIATVSYYDDLQYDIDLFTSLAKEIVVESIQSGLYECEPAIPQTLKEFLASYVTTQNVDTLFEDFQMLSYRLIEDLFTDLQENFEYFGEDTSPEKLYELIQSLDWLK